MSCGFCDSTQKAAYVCPRCKSPYCSVSCYRSKEHLECSELFYKRCAEEHMTAVAPRECDAEKMERILSRHHKQDEEYEDPRMLSRFRDIDISNVDSVMKVLTAEERESFSNLVTSERIHEFLPIWDPWWLQERVLIQEVKSVDPSDGKSEYKAHRKIIRDKLGGRKIRPLESRSERPEQDPVVIIGDSPITKTAETGGCGSVVEDAGNSEEGAPNPKRTSVVDVRYRTRKKSGNEQQGSRKGASTTPIEPLPSIEQRVTLRDGVFKIRDGESSVFCTKCANLLNLITTFAFTARYFNGDFQDLVEEAGRTFCSISLLFEQKECHEVSMAVSDVLVRSVVLENSDRSSLIKDARQICSSKTFVHRALSESGQLLAAYGKCFKSMPDPDMTALKQRIHKFRYKVFFYIDWIDGSFEQFREYSMPFLDLLLCESESIQKSM